jgi:hypothetical protein
MHRKNIGIAQECSSKQKIRKHKNLKGMIIRMDHRKNVRFLTTGSSGC